MSTHALTGPAPANIRFHPLRDSATMLRRNLKHMLRYPSMTVTLVGMPIVLLLLFVYVFGGTLGAGLGGVAGGRSRSPWTWPKASPPGSAPCTSPASRR